MRTNDIIYYSPSWKSNLKNAIWRWAYGIKCAIRRYFLLRELRKSKRIVLTTPEYLFEE